MHGVAIDGRVRCIADQVIWGVVTTGDEVPEVRRGLFHTAGAIEAAANDVDRAGAGQRFEDLERTCLTTAATGA
ncbi:unannotated protein [freshwater metagenome]|uniref:Unannotated protein n=1 Tax=freshwater metagenome TaxID=449393 RepID=A0A6J7ECV7_9ZZZZ